MHWPTISLSDIKIKYCVCFAGPKMKFIVCDCVVTETSLFSVIFVSGTKHNNKLDVVCMFYRNGVRVSYNVTAIGQCVQNVH